jgi:imidazolonepropionase-like amidohydrolase
MLAAGRRADLLVVEGNPLEDVGCLGRVRAVMKGGRWVHRPAGSDGRV